MINVVPEFKPVTVRVNKFRHLNISLDNPGPTAGVRIEVNTYDADRGGMKTFLLRISVDRLCNLINVLADVESFAVAQNWIEAPVNDDAADGGAA
jgi:hypothetical protein